MSFVDLLLGRRLANREYGQRRIGALEAVPAMGLDGLASSAYGPEAALTVLMPLGAASLAHIGWVMVPIMVLLGILFVSYWQTIRAYPNNGGAYIVSKDNLGTKASLLAAAALMIDYVLNVTVGISAGVGALVSAMPMLHGIMLPVCLGILLLLTLVNLRGTPDAGRAFALPTYLFIASFLAIMAVGIYRVAMSGGQPNAVVPPAPLPPATETISAWLLLRSFASGCTAMTGVEAVSNGMSAFRDPPVTQGHRTLAAIVGTLALLLAGVAYLAPAYHIGAMDQAKEGYRTVLAQLAGAVVGNGLFYYVAIAALLCVLCLSANTSFIDFPRLCRMVAEDGFLPKPFAMAGRRLVFSVGILYLAAAAGLLLVAFGGITDRLIPLFAIGAFLTFTLSQTGMVVHWLRAMRRERALPHRLHLAVNIVGAITTGGALVVIIIAKFMEGAWITILVIPCVLALLTSIRRYYDEVTKRLCEPKPLQLLDQRPPVVFVPIEHWNKPVDKAITLALTLSPKVIGVHLTHLAGPESEEPHRRLRAEWREHVEEPASKAGLKPPPLLILPAPYRAIHEPVLKLAEEFRARGERVAVLIPELVKDRWYQHLLHPHRAEQLRSALLKHGGSFVTVMEVPWHMYGSAEA